MKTVIFILLGLLLGVNHGAAGEVIVIDHFDNGLRPEWEEKTFKGRTNYSVVEENGNGVLKAESRDAASGLIFRINIDVKEYPILTWRWKVENILEKGDATRKEGDDYAARVYVVFPHWVPFKSRSINYIWANRLPQGEYVPSPFFRNSIMVAVRSGYAGVGRWQMERRNLLEDYRRIFGGDPPEASAVAIMTDTDNTGGSAKAFYDEIRLEKTP
ncbi:MAG: DUF3047 domain-containing protein [Desulfuromonadales bacterium]|nr:DUF3047 domain-containing protein [Desulfuromonadales bacterium]